MSQDIFFNSIRKYAALSEDAERSWAGILTEKRYKKGDNFISDGQVPKKLAFVLSGLFAQYYTTGNGEVITKYFFPEHRIAGSVGAMLTNQPSVFTITALENTTVLEYNFVAFRQLTAQYPDIAAFYIKYMEQHWIIEKEPYEISFRHDTASARYDEFVRRYPQLVKRLKKHHIASYLGITPTQLSRILLANK